MAIRILIAVTNVAKYGSDNLQGGAEGINIGFCAAIISSSGRRDTYQQTNF
jgi:hypothetical protein